MSEKIFISHASEDKADIALPLARSLKRRGFDVWYDDYSLELGDSLKVSIDKGLATAHFGVVILSKSFFAKRWPKEELDGLVAREVMENRKFILPVWHDIDFEEICKASPTLAGKLAIPSSNGIPEISKRIASAIEAERLKWVMRETKELDKRSELWQRFTKGTMQELASFADETAFSCVMFDVCIPPARADLMRKRISDVLEDEFDMKRLESPNDRDSDT